MFVVSKEQKMGFVTQPAEINGEPHNRVAVGSLRTCLCCWKRAAKWIACGSVFWVWHVLNWFPG